jgi:hypothetical protein
MSLGEIPGGNLRAYYKMENVNDSSGNGFNLTNNNSVTFPQGRFTNAANCGANNRGLSYVGNIFSTSTPDKFFASFWYKLESTANTTNRVVFSVSSDITSTAGREYQVNYNITGGQLNISFIRYVTTGNVTISVPSFTPDTDWHYLYIIYDSSIPAQTIFIDRDINKVNSSSNTTTGASNISGTVNLSLGVNRSIATNGALMSFDELIISEDLYVEAQASNILRYYEQAKGRFCI